MSSRSKGYVRRLLGCLAIWCAVAAGCAHSARAQELDSNNIYAEDVQHASEVLDRARERQTDGRSDLADTVTRLPAVERRYGRASRAALALQPPRQGRRDARIRPS